MMHDPVVIDSYLENDHVGLAIRRGFQTHVDRHGLPWLLRSPVTKAAVSRGADAAMGFFKRSALTRVEETGMPLIQFGQAEPAGSCWVRIAGEDDAVGAMAARRLLELGYRSFAAEGAAVPGVRRDRVRGFVAELERVGCGCALLPAGRKPSKEHPPEADLDRHLATWLRSLSLPVAVFYHQDRGAAHCAGVCRRFDLRVPDEVAILGVDDNAGICTTTDPPLSSVALPWSWMGELGALHLHRMLSGTASRETVLVPPLRVVERGSTARTGTGDALIDAALAILDAEFGGDLSVASLAARLGVDRSTLHRRCTAATGQGVCDHLHDRRVNRARELLATTDGTVAAIAMAVGYRSAHRLTAMFRKRTGMPPGSWRNRAASPSLR